MEPLDGAEHALGLGAAAEEDRLERLAGVGEAVERPSSERLCRRVPTKLSGAIAPMPSARCPYMRPTARCSWTRRSTDVPRGK